METVLLHSALPELPAGEAPEWVHFIPAGTFRGQDGRGPYTLRDPQAVIATSLQRANGRLPLDVNHAIDLAGKQGGESPARGWIVGLEARADGVWGKVEWTQTGRQMVAAREYRGISPAILRKPDGEVVALLRASLTNDPNLTQLATLHNRSTDMELIAQLRTALGLGADAPEADVVAAVTANHAAVETHAASLKAIATAAGLDAATPADALVTELQSRHAAGQQGDTQLRQTVVDLQNQLTTLQNITARKEAERVIDEGIKAGKVALVQLRTHYIDRHMADPVAVEKEIASMMGIIGGRTIVPTPVPPGEVSLHADERAVCEMMGIDPKAFAESRKALSMEAL
ncbi:phage protease [Pararhodobacter sp.]|uniref:phage protease n=1 Tax=Pararhodobacter sp. TaxID=2127056 RepID=UPI002AFE8F36|nr:phage protease [Pararhodobacter sp.]